MSVLYRLLAISITLMFATGAIALLALLARTEGGGRLEIDRSTAASAAAVIALTVVVIALIFVN